MTNPETFAEWAIVEQLGHRRLAGRLTEQTIAGGGYLRLDVPAVAARPATTHLLAHSSIYAIHPVPEDLARQVAERDHPEPVARWELPTSPPPGPSPLERDLLRLLDRVEHVTCEHGHQDAPDPACAGCIARSLATLAGRNGIDDTPDPCFPDEPTWGDHIAASPPSEAEILAMPKAKGGDCPACGHRIFVHEMRGCEVSGCECVAPHGRILPGDPRPGHI